MYNIPRNIYKLLPNGVWSENRSGYLYVQCGDITPEAEKVATYFFKKELQYLWDNGIVWEYMQADVFDSVVHRLSDVYDASMGY